MGQKLFPFTNWAIHFYLRFVNERQHLKAIIFLFLLFLTRRSWSLRKRLSHSRCASRSTTVWEESLSRRWASLPRSAPTPAGPSATSLLLSASPTFWCVVLCISLSLLGFIFLLISLTHPLCNLSRSCAIIYYPTSYLPQKWKPQPLIPKHPPARTHIHILHPAHYL